MAAEVLISVFAKVPLAGAVKTRLIPLLGPEGARDFHANCVVHALATAAMAADAQVALNCAPDASQPFFIELAARFGINVTEQGDGDLGARMHRAITNGLERFSRVLLIGSDCPVLTAAHLDAATTALNDAELVLIPAEDGGYALIGATRCDASLFANIRWGTDEVLAATRERIAALGWRSQELETLWDVDRPCDYQRLAASGLAPHLLLPPVLST